VSNIAITNCDLGEIAIDECSCQDETLTFAAADTFVPGTILARRAVATAVTASAITGTGNGTVTAATVVHGSAVPLVGAYVLRLILVVANGGVWQLEDPNGGIVASGLRMTVGAGAATVFEAGGLQFTITDGATDFALNDTATLTVAADGKLVPFNPASGGGVQHPIAVLQYEVTKAASGDLPIRPIVAGKVNRSRLVIDADGDGDNITNAHIDALRSAGIVALDVQQLATLDNQ
jgi:hypothetical protein